MRKSLVILGLISSPILQIGQSDCKTSEGCSYYTSCEERRRQEKDNKQQWYDNGCIMTVRDYVKKEGERR